METNTPTSQPSSTLPAERQGFTANTLKLIAITAMITSNISRAFIPMSSILGIAMLTISHITGPIMYYFLAEGYRHTQNKNMYTLRLGIFALISGISYDYFNLGMQSFSPFLFLHPLFWGHLAIRARHELENKILQTLVIIAAIGSIVCWGIGGIAIALVFDIYYDQFKKQAIAYSCIVLFFFMPWSLIVSHNIVYGMDTIITQLGYFIPLILLYFYNGRLGLGGPNLKWFFYIICPAHLLILGFLRFFVFV